MFHAVGLFCAFGGPRCPDPLRSPVLTAARPPAHYWSWPEPVFVRAVRLSSRSDRPLPLAQLRRRAEAWEKALAWWGGLGINTLLLRALLHGAGIGRRLFEEQLDARVHSTGKIRHARRALKRAEPLIRLFKTELALDGPPDLFFGDLGKEIERSVQNYVDALRGPARPAHHPGEPWLRKPVLLLTRLLRACGQSWSRTERAIHELFELDGHGDVVTREKIRHYIREERRRDPKFGAESPAWLGKWFEKEKAVRLTPNDLGVQQQRSRRPCRQVKNRRCVRRKKTKR